MSDNISGVFMSRKIKVTDEEIIETALNSQSATSAAAKLGIKYEKNLVVYNNLIFYYFMI